MEKGRVHGWGVGGRKCLGVVDSKRMNLRWMD